MSTANDDLSRLDLDAELKAAMEAERKKAPVRAKKRKGEPSLTVVVDEAPVVMVGSDVAPEAAVAEPAAPEAPPEAFEAPQAAPVGPFPRRAPQEPQGEAQEPAAPQSRQLAVQLAVMLTRAGRRPEGYDLPRDDRRRRSLVSCQPRVLGPGEKARFEVVAPSSPGAYELRAVQFPSFGAPRLLVEGLVLEEHAIMTGSVSAEAFTVAARENPTPFAVLAPESRLFVLVHNVSPTPVPVHPSVLLVALEPRAQQG